ncbi:MAG TPA: hypothetical protein VF043_33350 [Ktedonobacteraceae bacterium]
MSALFLRFSDWFLLFGGLLSPPGPAHSRDLPACRGEDGTPAPMGQRDPETGTSG